MKLRKNSVILIVVIFLFLGCIGIFIPSSNTIENNTIVENSINYSMLKDENFNIDKFLNLFNDNSSIKILNPTKFDISDISNEHYKTEYRLFKNAEAIYGNFNTSNIDIIVENSIFGNQIRIYLSNSNIKDMKSVVNTFLNILDMEDSKDYVLQEIENNNSSFFDGKKITGLASKTELMINVQ